MNNKIYYGFAVALLGGLAQVSSAENYNSELTASYLSGDVDGSSSNIDMYGVTQQVYLSAVDTSAGPLATAAFVSRASSYSLSYLEEHDLDADEAYAAMDWRDKESGLTLGLTYKFRDIDSDDSSYDSVELSVGKYIGETTEVSIQASYMENKLDANLHEEVYAVSISHVGMGAGDGGFALDGSFSVANKVTDDEQFGFAVTATLYPNRNLGLGAGFDIALADIDDDRVFAFAEWFFRPDVKGKATYYISDQDNVDVTGLSLELSLRL